MRRHTLLAVAAPLVAFAAPLSAQQLAAPPAVAAVHGSQAMTKALPSQTLTFNPIGLAAGFYSAEYERRVGTNVTLSLGGSYFDLGSDADKVSYLAGDLRARFYPRRALEGFAVGASVGLIQTGSKFDNFDGTSSTTHDNGFTLGTTIEHTWLLGVDNKYVFSVGGGFKRIVLFNGKQPDFDTFYPTLRTSFGIAF